MRENKRAENTRLIRLPNGQLVTEQQAKDMKRLSQLNQKQKNIERELELKHYSEKLAAVEKKQLQQKRQKTPINSNNKEDADILKVWKKQEEIKKETERLEIEYELAKKMAKELKRKLKEQKVPHEGQTIDEAFKDLLSPEAKTLAQKLKPALSTTQNRLRKIIEQLKISGKRYFRFAKIVYKKHKIASIAGLVASLIIVVGSSYLIFKSKPANVSISEVQGTSDQKKIPTNVTPDFATLIPADKSIEDLGGFAKVSPENAAPAFAFRDNISGTPIIVTQQKKPDSLSDQLKIEELAKSFNATKQVQIDQNVLYIGKSEKGPQSAIYVKDDILVLIKAEQEINEVDWVQYVTNLVRR